MTISKTVKTSIVRVNRKVLLYQVNVIAKLWTKCMITYSILFQVLELNSSASSIDLYLSIKNSSNLPL